MSAVNILFTTSAAPARSPFFTREKRPPLGVGSLISLLRSQGHTVSFIDNYLQPTRFIEEGYLQNNRIDVVGIHANTICYRDTRRMLSAIQELRETGKWEGTIVVGGPHTAVAPETIPDFVDHVVLGEGEQAIQDILNGTASGRILRSKRLEHLDSLPFQPWDIFARLPYTFSCPWMEADKVFTMNTSRGCTYQCQFCSACVIWDRKYTCFSAERIMAEIDHLVTNYGARGIYFREDHFTLSKKRTAAFCEELERRDYDLSWACETRVDNLDEELVELMSRAGCRAVYLGVESGSQRMLDMMKKGISVEQIRQALSWCRRHGIRAYCSLIVGLPGETYADYRRTLELMRETKPYQYGFNVFVGLPGSPLYGHILENKLYEHIDDLKLAYLPGYHIKSQFFYRRSNRELVDHSFTGLTDFDRRLLEDMRTWRYRLRPQLKKLRKRAGSLLPGPIKSRIKAWLKKRKSQR